MIILGAVLFCGISLWGDSHQDAAQNKTVEFGPVFDVECGLDYRLFWKVGFYGLYKYLYARKDVDGQRYIDFSEHIWLIGLSVRFSI